MKILIDECLPVALKGSLTALDHEWQTVRQAGFGCKKNGELLTLAEGRWDVLLTSARNIKYQQNMTGRSVSLLILCAKSNRMKDLLPLMPTCAQAILSIQAGRVAEVGAAGGQGFWTEGRWRRYELGRARLRRRVRKAVISC